MRREQRITGVVGAMFPFAIPSNLARAQIYKESPPHSKTREQTPRETESEEPPQHRGLTVGCHSTAQKFCLLHLLWSFS